MEEYHKKAIQDNRVALARDLTVNPEFLSYFSPDQILTDTIRETIMSKTTSSAKASEFLDTIQKRGKKAMTVFIRACIGTGVEHLADKLDPDIAKEELDKSENSARQDPDDLPCQSVDPSNLQPPHLHCQPMVPSDAHSTSVQESIHSVPAVKPFDEADSGLRKYLTNEEAYKMSSNPRGLAVIINIMFFSACEVEFRQDSEYDVDKLKTLFKHLHFEPVVHENLTASEIKTTVIETKKKLKPTHDAFVLCIMSYGREGKVIDTDGQEVHIQHDIIDQFNAGNCPMLRHKPKIFISETSNLLDNIDAGVEDDGRGEPDMSLDADIAKLSLEQTENKPLLLNLQADMLYVSSTGQGYKSMRNKDGVSYFIDTMDEVFKRFCCEEHVMDLLAKVRHKVIERRGQVESSNIPHEQTTLLKKLFFFPGYKRQFSVEESSPVVETNPTA